MSSPHKLCTNIWLSQYPNSWPVGWQIVPWKIPYKLQIKNFWTNLIPIKFHCYFCKVYKVAVTKQTLTEKDQDIYVYYG